MEFSQLNLSAGLFSNIVALGYKEPTPIQKQSMPLVVEGSDIAGLAQTGTGKTAAFLIPLIERLLRTEEWMQFKSEDEKSQMAPELQKRVFQNWNSKQFFLVLLPTRELAEQVLENFNSLTKNLPYKAVSIYGGTGYDKQKEALRSGVNFIFATPGRLIDLYKEHQLDLKQVRAIVFDEADRMFDMGFKDDMKYILQRVPKERQFLVFSATLNLEVLNTAYQFGANPVEINISRDKTSADNVKDYLFHVGDAEKPQHLISLLKKSKSQQTIIFTNFKHNVERVAQFLSQNKYPAIAISSLLSQAQRTRVLSQFKESNEINIMVATDIAARGLDIQGVDLVVNYELPNDSETYVHRIGRTGRAGATGTAYSLCGEKDIEALSRIEEYLNRKIDVEFLEDVDLIKEFISFKDMKFDRMDDNHQGPFRGNRYQSRGQGRSQNRPQGRSHFKDNNFKENRRDASSVHRQKSQNSEDQKNIYADQKSERRTDSKSYQSYKEFKSKQNSRVPHSREYTDGTSGAKTGNNKYTNRSQSSSIHHSKGRRPTQAAHSKMAKRETSLGGKILSFFKKIIGK